MRAAIQVEAGILAEHLLVMGYLFAASLTNMELTYNSTFDTLSLSFKGVRKS